MANDRLACCRFEIDFAHEGVQSDIARDRDFLKPVPERILKAKACPATSNKDGSSRCASHLPL